MPRPPLPQGLIHTRIARIDDLAIAGADRLLRWPSGRRQDAYPGLTDLGL